MTRRRRRWPWLLLVIVIVLAGAFVVVDRIALALAQRKAATSLQSSQNLQHRPSVSIAGFPFLTQVIGRDFTRITITADDIQVGSGRGLRLAAVIVHLHHVTVNSGYSSFRARTADATALITYSDFSHALGIAVSNGGGGRLVAKPSVTVLGQKFSATVSAVVQASSSHGIDFDSPKVSADGISLPSFATRALAAVFETVISLKGLPFNAQVDGVAVTSAGVVLRLSGTNLIDSRP